jgi:hypothetical protein
METKPYSPQVSVEKGAIEGTITTVASALVVGFMPNADPIQIAAAIGGIVAVAKFARNWWKNRKGVAR